MGEGLKGRASYFPVSWSWEDLGEYLSIGKAVKLPEASIHLT